MVFRLISVCMLFVILFINPNISVRAACPGNFRGEGAVTFYWREKEQEREGQMRNWGKLEETLEETKYKELTEYFDPKYVYAYTVTGECCWKIFNETNFKGPAEDLELGFRGIPKYPQFNVNSLRKVPC